MSTATKIEWTDATWNPTTGCTRVSAGCEHCYIERTPPMRANRRFEGPHIGASTKGGVQLHPDRLDQPLHWRKPRRVFVNSMSDLFHPDVPLDFITSIFAVMALADRHQFQVLTKRPRRMKRVVDDPADEILANTFEARVGKRAMEIAASRGENVSDPWWDTWWTWPLRNVWLGTSVENQEWADKRIPLLLETPAAVRFLSCEPLLGPIDLVPYFELPAAGPRGIINAPDLYIHWVIVGGESGPGARPMHPDWARSLRDQCVAAGVPFFFKQWGEWRWVREACDFEYEQAVGDLFPNVKWEVVRIDGSIDESNIPRADDSTVMQRVGKKRAGRELDGRTWDEMPDQVPT